MKGFLDIKIYKNSDLSYENNNIEYTKDNDIYTFVTEDVKNIISLGIDKLEYTRENNEYHFELIVSKKSTCKYLLKEINSYIDILVDDACFEKRDNLLIINYQIESDDKYTTIEIMFK